MPKIEAPRDLLCFLTKLTKQLFEEPVTANDGYTYEKRAIEKWIAEKGTSPITRNKIKKFLVNNLDKKKQVLDFLEKNNVCSLEEFEKALEKSLRNKTLLNIKKINYLDCYLRAKMRYKGYTPLHLAVNSYNYLELAEWLLSEEADVSAMDDNGCTPLHWATHPETIDRLLDSGANLEAKNNNLETPLHSAAVSGHTEAVKQLICRGANVNAENNKGEIPINLLVHLCCNELILNIAVI